MPLLPRFTPVCLLILDGWGIGPNQPGNAIQQAHTPNMDQFWHVYPHTQLTASGESVGLPHGEDGNTETGHLNLGAGQIVYQDLPRINMAIADGSFFINQEFMSAFQHTKKQGSHLHLIGLVGLGGVHSNIEHLFALLHAAKSQGLTDNVYLHLFTDGRDSPPTAGVTYLSTIQEKINTIGLGTIATIMGRYYGMDRDFRWERTEIAYRALTEGIGQPTTNLVQALKNSYEQNITDEFIKPLIVTNTDGAITPRIKDNDAVIFFNFRIDRPRQLTKAFVLDNFEQQAQEIKGFDPYAVKYFKTHQPIVKSTQPFTRKLVPKNLCFVTMTEYEKGLPTHIAFPPSIVDMPLSRAIANQGWRQLKIAETEKERFVTYYFNGQRETPFPGEEWQIIPSKKVPTYDTAPEMSSREIKDAVITAANSTNYQLLVVNFASPDMVAHTGNLQATKIACEIVDQCVGEIATSIDSLGGITLITADHGNAEELINAETGEVDTEHSSSPVPFIMVSKHFRGQIITLPKGILADVGPTVLQLLGVAKPGSMTGKSFV